MDKVLIDKDGRKYILNIKNNNITINSLDEASKEINIIDNVNSDFDASFDSNKDLYIVYFSKEQNLVIVSYKDKKVTKSVIYHYNENNIFIDNLRLFIVKNEIHVFFMEHNKSSSRNIRLKHYCFNNVWKINEIAVIKSSLKPFYNVDVDNYGILHVVYITNENICRIYYTTYINDIWAQKTIISEAVSISYPNIKIDDKRNIHICWVEENIIKELKYRKKVDGGWPKGSWDKKITLSFSDNIINPYMRIINNNLWCTWIQQNSFYNAISSDGGNSFSKPFKLAEKPLNYEFIKKIDPTCEKISYVNLNGEDIPLAEETTGISYDKESYFTFYIKEVQEYLNALSKKIENLQKEKIRLERNLSQRNYEVSLKNRSIEELKDNLKKIYEDKAKYSSKVDNLNTMYNGVLSENERLKKQIKDLQNKIIILNSKLNEKMEMGTIDKLKSIFFGKSNEHL